MRRGLILAPDARARAQPRRRAPRQERSTSARYPQGRLAAHVVGYSTASREPRGAREVAERDPDGHRARASPTSSTASSTSSRASRSSATRSSRRSTCTRSRWRSTQLGRTCGAVVALDPRSGKLLVMASSPSYNPNLVESNFGEDREDHGRLPAGRAARSTARSQGLYPPGSTFKVVTASAALESNRFTPDSSSTTPATASPTASGSTTSTRARPFGSALPRHGAPVLRQLGVLQHRQGARREADPRAGEASSASTSGRRSRRRTASATRAGSTGTASSGTRSATRDVDAGRMAFGQERLLVTPLQMAMVAGGDRQRRHRDAPVRRREDRLAERQDACRARSRERARPRGRARQRARHRRHDGAAPSRRAPARRRRSRASGSAARPARPRPASPGSNTTWFIAFAGRPGKRPEVAIAVALESQSLTGGATAAPIARAVMQALLRPPTANSVTCTADLMATHRRATRNHLRRPLPARAQARLAAAWRTSGSPRTRSSAARSRSRSSTSATRTTTQFVERFRREATHAAGLSHPNIVSIYDRGEAEGSYFIVMEYVEGRTLKELIVTRGPCPVPVAISYVAPDPRRAPLRAPERDRPPRHQAAQRARRPRGPRQGRGLRHRARGLEPDDRGGLDHRHRAVPLARAGARRAGRRDAPTSTRPGSSSTSCSPATVPFTGETPVEIAMKHLSQVPRRAVDASAPRSRATSTSSSLRALAKEPADRYRSAKEMDRDLELVGARRRRRRRDRGGRDDGARAGESTAATTVARRAPAGLRRRRALPLLRRARCARRAHGGRGCSRPAAAIALGDRRLAPLRQRPGPDRRQRAGRRSDNYTGILEQKAVDLIDGDGFEPNVRRLPNADSRAGIRLRAGAGSPGTELAEGRHRHDPRLDGQAEGRRCPTSSASRATHAVAELTTRRPRGQRASRCPPTSRRGTVTAQDPRPGASLVAGASVRINVSTGPKPVAVPNVVGLDYDVAAAQLQAAGFTVGTGRRRERPAGRRGRRPERRPATRRRRRARPSTLSVSNGPDRPSTVPDVTLPDASPTRGRR